MQVKEKEQRASGGLDGEGRATESGEETRGRESTTAKQEERDGETDRWRIKREREREREWRLGCRERDVAKGREEDG